MEILTNPCIGTLGISVIGVNWGSGVSVNTVGVNSIVGVDVLVIWPANVGVTVKVNVGVIGV